jgi:hypothetical protein
LGWEQATTFQLFGFSLEFGNMQGWGRNHNKHTTQTEQDGQWGGVGKGGTLQQSFFSSTSLLSLATPLKRAQPHLIPFVENTKKQHTNPDGHGWRGTKGARNAPGKTENDLHGCLPYFAAESRAITRL